MQILATSAALSAVRAKSGLQRGPLAEELHCGKGGLASRGVLGDRGELPGVRQLAGRRIRVRHRDGAAPGW